jgi:DDE family transposase
VTLTTRMRCTAALYELAPPPTGKRGRPRLKGKRLPSLTKLAQTLLFQEVTITGPDGKQRLEHVAELDCLWYGPFHTRPIKLLLVRSPDRTDGYDIAIASTDTDASAATLIARYQGRWTIETSFQEGKAHGVGQARNRVQRAVERTVPFGFLCQTLTIVWYQLYGDADRDVRARRRIAPWYPHKQTVSYSDMLAGLRRELIRAEFHAQAPRRTLTPQIAQAPSPSALTAA